MSLSALIRKRQRANFATATVATFATVRPKPQPCVATVASVAVANAETVKTDNCKPCSRWLFRFADRDALPVTFAPAVDQAGALVPCPDAVAAEPITDMPGNPLASFWADSDVDRNNQLESGGGQLSPLAKACTDCQHFARPGKSDGYCGGRDDLPFAYGANHPLRRLPADGGKSCEAWQATE